MNELDNGIKQRSGAWLRAMCVAAAAIMALPMSAAVAQKAAAPPPPETMAKQASKAYHEALSQMRIGNAQQAADLFTQVIKRFPGFESIPDAQLYLASCLLKQKKDDEFLRQVDLANRAYVGTEISMLASSLKAGYYAGRRDVPGLLEVLKEAAGPGNQPLPYYLLDPGAYHYYQTNVQSLRSHFARDFRDDLVKLCNKPDLAEQALQALAGTFRQSAEKLPSDWLWTHCQLLLVANKDAEAERTFKQYTDFWGTDVRGRSLWWEYAEFLRTARKKPAEAKKIYEMIMQRYEGTDTAADAGLQIATMLAADASQVKEFLAFAEPFVARYRLTDGANRVEGMILQKVLELAPTDKAMAERAYKMLQQDIDQLLPPDRADRVERQIRLAITLKDPAKAVSLMNEFLSDGLWSAVVYNKALGLAGLLAELKPLVETAKHRRQIYDPPTAAQVASTQPAETPALEQAVAAARLLEQLKVRIKDEQMRFAEEICDDLFGKHTDTAATVDGVALMCDYYFKQVLVEPRDKWMERMIATYPFHPKTEDVLNKRCIADRAAAEYDKLTKNVELALSRFPTSQHRHSWYTHRLACYDAAKDAAGKHELVAKELNWTAMRGNLYHIELIIQSIPTQEGQNRGEVAADAYMDWGKKLGQTNVALSCYGRACSSYEYHKLWPKAINASNQLRNQKINPAVAWTYQFNDIDLLLKQGKHAEAVSAANQRLASEPKPQFRTYRQFDMGSLGQAFGKLNRVSEGKALSAKLAQLYVFPDDIDRAELMLASVYTAADDPKPSPRAADVMLKVAKRLNPTDLGYGLCMSAAYQVRNTPQYDDVINLAMRQMPRAHHLLPKMLSTLGQHYLAAKDRKALTIQSQLQSGYPASAARDELDAKIEAARGRDR